MHPAFLTKQSIDANPESVFHGYVSRRFDVDLGEDDQIQIDGEDVQEVLTLSISSMLDPKIVPSD
jgi:hypothetical protein